MSHSHGRPLAQATFALGMALALASTIMPWPAHAATPLDFFYERSVMAAADARCRLFSPELSSTLVASRAQARGAALRAGADIVALSGIAQRALVKAGAVACGSPDLVKAAGRVRAAFDGYSRLIRLDLPGDTASWRADRTAPSSSAGWRLSQNAQVGAAALTFGLAGRRGETPRLTAVMAFGAGPGPYAVRLLVRDPSRAPQPYLNVLRVSATAGIPLTARTPPRLAARVFESEAMAPADLRLLPAGAASATAFRFPAAAVDAISGLDPREAITVELLFAGRSGDSVRHAFIEVGDFAAGLAFITLPKR